MNAPSDGGTPNDTTPFPTIDDGGSPAAETPTTPDERHDDKEKDATTTRKKPGSHRRTISGNLLKLLKTGSSERVDQDVSPSREKSRGGGAMAGLVAESTRRKRKGSLRKTVLGKSKEKERDRKAKSPLASPVVSSFVAIESPTEGSMNATPLATPRPSLDSTSADSPSSSPEHPTAPPPPRWQAPFRTLSRVSIPSIRSSAPSADPSSSAASVHHQHTTSTSEDEANGNDAFATGSSSAQPPSRFPSLRKTPTRSSIDSATSSSSWIYPSVVPSVAASISTAPSLLSDTLRRSTHHLGYFASSHTAAHAAVQQQHAALARSPLASAPQSVANSPTHSDAEADSDLDDDELTHPYDLTAFWGYIILATTYIVFVVGMGSCFGVWSWAWDVGETPYAPPELEDDASLPIVGYYPALMVLTAVMAWVWVVVAWVGMKYFRHADFRGDDG